MFKNLSRRLSSTIRALTGRYCWGRSFKDRHNSISFRDSSEARGDDFIFNRKGSIGATAMAVERRQVAREEGTREAVIREEVTREEVTREEVTRGEVIRGEEWS